MTIDDEPLGLHAYTYSDKHGEEKIVTAVIPGDKQIYIHLTGCKKDRRLQNLRKIAETRTINSTVMGLQLAELLN